jgi:hypothetical protein
VRDVLFTAPGRGTRSVPACAQDAARLEAGEKPEVRKVKVGSRLVPYWEAGAAYLPYGEGYFVTGALAGTGTLGWAFDPQVIEYTSDFSGDHGGGGFGGDGGGGADGGFGDGGGGGDGGM